jgi:hypothetical protein
MSLERGDASENRISDACELFGGSVIGKDIQKPVQEDLWQEAKVRLKEARAILMKEEPKKEVIEIKEVVKVKEENGTYKAQVSFNIDGCMVNIRGEDDDVKKRAVEWLKEMEAYKLALYTIQHPMAKPGGTVAVPEPDYEAVEWLKELEDLPEPEYQEPKGTLMKAPACAKCGGECYDNRQKIKSGKFSPRSPQFSCKDKQCGTAAWIKDGKLSWSFKKGAR